MVVRDYMSVPPITLTTDDSYHAALRLLQENRLHHVPVVDHRKALVGILAERDLLLAAARYMHNPVDVNEVMHRDVVTAMPETPLSEAATLMTTHKIGSLPVVDAEDKLVGIITETDILRAFIDLLART